MEIDAINRLTALGHEQRLAVFRLLARRYPDAVPAGEIARALGIKANTLSSYLATLMHAGLVGQTRVGTSLKYRVEWAAVHQLTDFLYLDCCRGRPDLCPPPGAAANGGNRLPRRKLNVLFICSGNSARSILAESLLRHEAGDRFDVFSAGTHPRPAPDPRVIELLRAKGHDISMLRSKGLEDVRGADAPEMDFVFTVCDRAANEDCATWQARPISGHWGVADPTLQDGTEAEKRLAFQETYAGLRRRISAFAALPFDTLDRIALQRRVDDLVNEEDPE